jgi:hypothetical protein
MSDWDFPWFLVWWIVGPMLLVLVCQFPIGPKARGIAKALAWLFGSVLALAFGTLALFGPRLKGAHPSDEVLIFLLAVIAGAGLLGSLFSPVVVSIPGKESSPPAGG